MNRSDIEMAIVKLHDWLTTPKKVEMKIGASLIDEATAAALNAQIARIKDGAYSHIHMSDVQKLREALDAWQRLFPYNGPRLGD